MIPGGTFTFPIFLESKEIIDRIPIYLRLTFIHENAIFRRVVMSGAFPGQMKRDRIILCLYAIPVVFKGG